MTAKVAVIGLDACDKDLVVHWAADGSLPTFRRLLEASLRGETSNPAGFFGGTVWPSFATGLSPAGHGRYCAMQVAGGTYGPRPVSPMDIRGVPFWERVSAGGRRVAVIDVPLSRPSRDLDGVQICDLATHDPVFTPPRTFPPALAAEIGSRFGPVVADRCDHGGPGPRSSRSSIDALVQDLLRRLGTKAAVCRHYLERGEWDLFVAVFGEAHCIGHQAWHLHDPAHPLHMPSLAAEVGDPVRHVYQALDAEVGALLACLDPETRVIVVLSHGMGRVTSDQAAVLDEVLHRLDPARRSVRARVFRALRRAWYGLPAVARRPGALDVVKRAALPHLRSTLAMPGQHSRSFFAIPSDTSTGAVRINLAGREPAGRVAPAAYRSVIEDLRRDLLSLVDPQTRTPFVRAIHVVRDVFRGARVGDLPDLLLEWNQDHRFTTVSSDKVGRLSVPLIGARSGDHRGTGMFFGLGFGARGTVLARQVAVVDFAPTVGHLLGVRLDDVDGRPIDELVGERVGAA